jgi:hypothetical protein
MQCRQRVYARFTHVYANRLQVYADLRKVYAEFTQSLRRIYVEDISSTNVRKPAKSEFTHGLRRVYAGGNLLMYLDHANMISFRT